MMDLLDRARDWWYGSSAKISLPKRTRQPTYLENIPEFSCSLQHYHSPTVGEGPVADGGNRDNSRVTFSPVSVVHNKWPQKLDNVSLFNFLLPRTHTCKYPDFYDFVKRWYKTACAIVYQNPNGEFEIIGSGALIARDWIATARHNFEGYDLNRLYVRFFEHSVRADFSNSNKIIVSTRFLDFSVLNSNPTLNGTDAGYLQISQLVDVSLFNRFCKILQCSEQTPTSSELYVMFHFADGMPQVSAGQIPSCELGTPLQVQIAIQAGSGASGAAIIIKNFKTVEGCGISIFRMIDQFTVERRIIAFNQFSGYISPDRISTPYLADHDFSPPIAATSFSESGPEFLPHSKFFQEKGKRLDKPGHLKGTIRDNFSIHHIIPIRSLEYLFEYFFKNDIDVQRNRRSAWIAVAPDELEILRNNYEDIRQLIIKLLNPYHLINTYPRIFISQEQIQYGRTRGYFQEDIRNFLKNYFCTPEWNSFLGWERPLRSDDPADDLAKGKSEDESEKNCPSSFPPEIWNCLKHPKNGLYHAINQLEKVSDAPEPKRTYSSRVKAAEEQIKACLQQLSFAWSQRPPTTKKTAWPYVKTDWVETSPKSGIYHVRT